ncbi:MFS transporter [Mycolicibacterium mageritense]|nr:MFS transporter [Mycolicibacterium mageritense]MCC9184499.1 MFS transporter [Mycolicibacterium mageritense]CDO21694.1 transmembrane efflux pump [Mycolicibacterium mageritense DSM 44476 = CIP 104973]
MKIRNAAPTSRVMVVAVMVSMVAFLDSTVVNLALPATIRDLGGGMGLQQWVVDGYLLALGAMILPGGSISDLLGRVRVMRFGLVAFGVGSVLAATAPSPVVLIVARVVQGLGAAFLVPGSLAMINAAFDGAGRSAAIGAWTAWTRIAFAFGPLLGGLAVDLLTWRWIYVLSAVPMVVGFALTFWMCPMPEPAGHAHVDLAGGLLSATGLAATVYALIESQGRGWADPVVSASFVVGVTALVGFIEWQRRAAHPMLPLHLFTSRNFAGGNLATAFVYGGLALGTLVIALYLQEVIGSSATSAGLVTLPIPILSFLFARRVGAAATRIGPRMFVIGGPIIAAIGLLMIRPVAGDFHVLSQVMPGMTLFATGLVITVTPLTAVCLSAVDPMRGGIASAINNAASRLAGLIAVACMGLIAAGTLTDASFPRLLQASAMLFVTGAVVCAVTITHPEIPANSVPCEIAAMCRDRPGAQPVLADRDWRPHHGES